MKIIIEGEPKEIAALEQALKSGKTLVNLSSDVNPEQTIKQIRKSARDMILRGPIF